ncbi:MAG: OmpA family protein [Candidatus Sumerlaeota bacterium]
MRRRLRENIEISFWPGFVDVLLAVVLVLLFLVTVFVISQTGLVNVLSQKDVVLENLSAQINELEKLLGIEREEAEKLRTQLASTQQELEDTESTLERTVASLGKTTEDLSATREDLTQSQEDLATAFTSYTTTASALRATRAELEEAEQLSAERQQRIQADEKRIAELTKKISEYVEQLEDLNSRLGEARASLKTKDASLEELNARVRDLSEMVALLSSQLGEAKENVAGQKLRIAELLKELDQREKEIARLRSFEKYRSEFLAKLSDVFADKSNIRVVGDRFVFQGEVLFPSGSAELTEAGKNVLSQFVQIYKDLEKSIPEDIALNIQIQGHTDTDPISTAQFPSNWELSTARAVRVVRYLSLHGIPQNMLSAAGFGEHYPAVADDTETAKRQNRRIEILFTQR